MNKEIANILKERLQGLKIADDIAGLVQTVEFSVPSDGEPTRKRMPVSIDLANKPNCKISPENAMIPNSKKKGILYFEDLGSTFVDRESGGAMRYRSRLVLVCWMNRARLTGNNYSEISTYCITAILGKLNPKALTNEGNFSRFQVTPGRILPQDASVFSRYSYDEAITQYLRPPFEFFGIELSVDYCIHPSCIDKVLFIDEKDASCY